MANYIVRRHGSNGANQSMCQVSNGQAYGPFDSVDEGVFGFTPAREIVLNFARKENLKAAITHGGIMLDSGLAAMVEKFLLLAGLGGD